MGAEQRRHPRRRVEEDIPVVDVIRERVVGRLGDLSVGGLMLIADRVLGDDALFQFRFELNDARGRPHPIEVGVHELWSAPLAGGAVLCGFRIIDIAPEDEPRIAHWVKHGHLDAR
ncbi:MAG: PilZ domain-containing protein [Xanthomonadales bacterium]|nr:PilZ domain-containing protein [Xanthomonadales bacterium]